jgi:large subunit ribosomal protein L35
MIEVRHCSGMARSFSGQVHFDQNWVSSLSCPAKEEKMPKMKTNRGAAKRFKTTGNGKIVRSKAFGNHILTKKTTKRKRRIRQSSLVDGTNMKNVKKLIPYL